MATTTHKEDTVSLTVTRLEIRPRKFDGTAREYYAKSRVYVFPKGESVLENLFVGRHNRPVDLYKAEVLPIVKDEIARYRRVELGETDTTPDMIQLRWSQKAGCSCGCSPGFIVTGLDRADVFVTVEAADDAASVTPEAHDALEDFRANSGSDSGRGPNGNLRNFARMGDAKLLKVYHQLVVEGNDVEALRAAAAEIAAR